MDKLALLHPSLGLAFTNHFMARAEAAQADWRRLTGRDVLQGNKATDQLPDGCDGCREGIGGRLVCCINQEDEE